MITYLYLVRRHGVFSFVLRDAGSSLVLSWEAPASNRSYLERRRCLRRRAHPYYARRRGFP